MSNIINVIKTLFTRENITFFFAIVGFLGTVNTVLMQRKKLKLSIITYRSSQHCVLMYVSITNFSHLSISISNISIVHDNICYPCAIIPKKVMDTTHTVGKQIVSYKEEYSIEFPINLSSLAGTSGYLYFDKPPNTYPTSPTTLTVQVSSNRGKATKMILSIPQETQ